MLIPLGASRILIAQLPEDIQQVQGFSSLSSEASVLILSFLFYYFFNISMMYFMWNFLTMVKHTQGEHVEPVSGLLGIIL